ncbi:TPA: hypothetical protein HA265_00385, partial [Candidatus Woesearchaeota archaeon]|nr:hypothetical protein [Candidatus Woesearchaeota archaeon]
MKIINQADMLIGMIRRAALGMALAATLSGCHVYKGKIEGCEVTVDQKALMDYEGIDIGAYYRTRVKCQGEEVYFFHYERYGDLERMCRSGLGMGKDCVR